MAVKYCKSFSEVYFQCSWFDLFLYFLLAHPKADVGPSIDKAIDKADVGPSIDKADVVGNLCPCGCKKPPSTLNAHACIRCNRDVYQGFNCFFQPSEGNETIYGNCGVCHSCNNAWTNAGKKTQSVAQMKAEYKNWQKQRSGGAKAVAVTAVTAVTPTETTKKSKVVHSHGFEKKAKKIKSGEQESSSIK